ncbi:MAG: hypothetical protein ABL984_03335 [Pyrinomonadaceae bacterium]
MAVVVRFAPTGLTEASYAECLTKLDAAGAGSPAGRLFHVCFGDKDNLRVSDIWDSRESFEQFSQKLGPILGELGVKGEPEFIEIHNIIEGSKASSTTG